MRVVLDNGTTIELGDVEATPTIGITDYSRRVTDDFGITTVVERAFSRRMSVKLGLPFDNVGAVQQQLADLRATSALWIADDRFAWLSARGFYKDFDIDHASPPLSYCTLTVEGLAETSIAADDGTDPAPIGTTSTLRLLQPADINDQVLASSSVPENDYPEWAAVTSYPLAARVIKASTHRVYESVAAANSGNDPAGASGKWLDVGPTNRWAMFDQALGSLTSSANSITVALNVSGINAVALLDVVGAQVHVQATGYDSTMPTIAGAITFFGLPETAKRVTVTITGPGQVSAGTLMIGRLLSLGITEASPTAGITDFSRKNVDDFGEVTVVPRAWSKRMTAKALIRTEAIDVVANRIATVRARPSLWIGQAGLDSLTVYGFFKDFSIEVGINVSKLSLSIEGLSKAAPLAPPTVAWPNVTDPDGTKPDNNADVTGDHTSKDTNAVGGKPAIDLLKSLDDLEKVTIPAVNAAVAQAEARAAAAVAEANARISAAQLTLDDAVADLANEIARAQGKDEQLVQRIDAIVAEAGDSNTNIRALIERAETARADGDRALANRIDTVVTSYQDLNTATNTRITQQATALSNADQALGQRIDSVTADYQGRDTATNTRITTTATGLANADQALGQRIDSVQSSFTTGGGNLLNNTDFVTTDGWSENFNMPRPNYGINAAGAPYHPVGENVLSIYQPGRVGSPNYYADWISTAVAVVPGSFLQFSAMFASHRADTQAILCWVGTDGVIFDYAYGNGNTSTENLANDPNLYKRSGQASVQVPTRAVAVQLIMRKIDTYAGQGDSYAWFWRPYIGAARQGQNSWNDWSPGKARAVQIASDARVETQITTLADADRAIGQRIDSVTADYKAADVAANARITDTNTAFASADTALGQRSDNIEVSLNNARSRLSTVETATTDGRFADAQRATNIEASLNNARGRLSTVETATTDGRFAAAQRVDSIEVSLNNARASITEQAGAIAGIDGRTSVYWKVTGTTSDGSATVSLSKADGSPGVFYIGTNLVVDGAAIFNSTVTIRALDRSTMTATTSGSVSGNYGGAGQASKQYIPNLGADMFIRSGGSIYIAFTGNIGGTTNGTRDTQPTVDILNAADNSILAAVPLPESGFGSSGRLDNYTLRILNTFGDVTIRWRVAVRTTERNWSNISNPALSVYWTAL